MTEIELVKRLRSRADDSETMYDTEIMVEAADAIEALTAALEKTFRALGEQVSIKEYADALDAAHAALRKVRP